ncbi:gamma-glutamyl hydrolase-like [Anneissia japonica]|uniref:gamma-glutamyl hydrolase-like n=1 Tax=Anneissia japonica TaxID=1529436 RepID=UPI0014259EBA|nr:gamma-glutamyl hydrolase-like [Anneissia japonica]
MLCCSFVFCNAEKMALEPGTVKFTVSMIYLICLCSGKKVNDRPIIGVMSQETHGDLGKFGPSVVVASYVKLVESGGARVALVKINQSMDYYIKMFNSINGLIFPGGGQSDILNSGYGKAAKIFFSMAVESNNKGDYFPIWGTCQGLLLLAAIVAGEDISGSVDCVNVAVPLKPTPDFVKSRIFDIKTPDCVLKALTTENSTYNHHKFSVTPKNFTKFGLDKFYRIISVNEGGNGLEFISTLEALDYPIYGIQWHPEKTLFEWNPHKDSAIPHFPNAVAVAQHVVNFLVSEARKSHHRFSSEDEASKYLVYNYQPVYTGNVVSYELCYFLDM